VKPPQNARDWHVGKPQRPRRRRGWRSYDDVFGQRESGRAPRARGLRLLTLRLIRIGVTHVPLPCLVLLALFTASIPYCLPAGPDSPALLAALVPLALVAVHLLLQPWFRPRLEVHCRFPPRAMAGSHIRMLYTCTNHGRRTAYDVHIDRLPLPFGMQHEQWQRSIAALEPGRQVELHGNILVSSRGVYRMPILRYDTTYPFGLWRMGRFVRTPRHLRVFPQFTPIAHIGIAFGKRSDAAGLQIVDRASVAHDFRGCREYREGDDPRHLHSRSWARLGVPVVKEYEDQCLSRTALILDTYLPPARRWDSNLERLQHLTARQKRRHDLFESSVSLLAAVADYMARRDHLIEFFAAGRKVYHFRSDGRFSFLQALLDILAGIEPVSRPALDRVLPHVRQNLREIRSAVFFVLNWDERRRAAVENLRHEGVATHVFLVSADHGTAPSPRGIDRVFAPRDILDGKVIEIS